MQKVLQQPSPNFSERAAGVKLDTLVLHNTDGPASGALLWLCSPESQVSAHYLVARDGSVYQLVAEDKKAWHARQANSRSIGIEIEAHAKAKGLTQTQEHALVALCRDVMRRHNLMLGDVVPHRKVVQTSCPGWVWPTDADFYGWTKVRLTPVAEQEKP